MLIAQAKRKENIAEYLLYMWQVEDIIRAFKLDIDAIDEAIIARYDASDNDRAQMRDWYESLIKMMQLENKREKGHLQINKNSLSELNDLHQRLLNSQKFPYYREMYYRVLPYIVELRSKSPDKDVSELETCFNALYGPLMLRLQHKDISRETQKATQDISTLLGQLSDYYIKDKAEPLI